MFYNNLVKRRLMKCLIMNEFIQFRCRGLEEAKLLQIIINYVLLGSYFINLINVTTQNLWIARYVQMFFHLFFQKIQFFM